MRDIFILVCLMTCQDTPEQEAQKAALEQALPSMEQVIGISFTDAERQLMVGTLIEQLQAYAAIHGRKLGNDVPPALVFNPIKPPPAGTDGPTRWSPIPIPARPSDLNQLAYVSLHELSAMIEHRVITSSELTAITIKRLKQYDPKLKCVVTLLENEAMARAAQLDREIEAGTYRGPLHGIPYGAKDLLATRSHPTTWGAEPFRDQHLDIDAAVIEKLDRAGAVLVAKLTLGALAWGDVWYGGMTRNPWNTEEGSSGSSAGPASAVAAGLVPFAIGSETYGSIVSPSTRCGVTGLRPTFGVVSRYGAMALSWSMDKLGPIARDAEDCAIVLDTIRGADTRDPASRDAPFAYRPMTTLAGTRIGFVPEAFQQDGPWQAHDLRFKDLLASLGAELVPIELPDKQSEPLSIILTAEAAAAFDQLTRSGMDDTLVRQIENAWPNVFRAAQTIPAVSYIQANRLRVTMMRQLDRVFDDVDLYVSPTFAGFNLLMTNLTGQPCVVMPNGPYTQENGIPSITLIGDLYDDARLAAVSHLVQKESDWHRRKPPAFQ